MVAVVEARVTDRTGARPAEVCRELLAALEASEWARGSEGEPMNVRWCGVLLVVAACGGGARRAGAPAAPAAELLRPLQVPETPSRIIYSPPVNLAKPPDTTAHGRKPRS